MIASLSFSVTVHTLLGNCIVIFAKGKSWLYGLYVYLYIIQFANIMIASIQQKILTKRILVILWIK
ncbi:hypothetical protein CWI88_22220 [Enterobacter cancerogenus]|nr:hypothetical protein CWI88_22220 [Enterobacter cancerogenus]